MNQDFDQKPLGQRLKERREELGLSREALGKRLGISRNSIYNYENGGEVTLKYIKVVEDFLNIPVTNHAKFTELPTGQCKMEVPYVPIQCYKSFIDNNFPKNLTVNFIVDHKEEGSYAAFEIDTIAMENGQEHSLKKKDVALAKEINKISFHKELDNYNIWIFIIEDTILCRSVKDFDMNKNQIICTSLKQSIEFPDFPLELDSIDRIFKVLKRTTDL